MTASRIPIEGRDEWFGRGSRAIGMSDVRLRGVPSRGATPREIDALAAYVAAGGSVADRISKEDLPGDEIDFMGIVEGIGDSSWTISGQVVGIDASTQIIGSPQVGDNVEVEARKAADGSLTASKIKKEDAVEQEVEFTGKVESIGDLSWQIAGQPILVNASTRIEGNPAVGDTVEVKAMKAADGSLTATRIKNDGAVGSGEGNNGDHSGSSGGSGSDNGGSSSSSGHPDGNDGGGNGSSGND